jgi:hypothetical protein
MIFYKVLRITLNKLISLLLSAWSWASNKEIAMERKKNDR